MLRILWCTLLGGALILSNLPTGGWPYETIAFYASNHWFHFLLYTAIVAIPVALWKRKYRFMLSLVAVLLVIALGSLQTFIPGHRNRSAECHARSVRRGRRCVAWLESTHDSRPTATRRERQAPIRRLTGDLKSYRYCRDAGRGIWTENTTMNNRVYLSVPHMGGAEMPFVEEAFASNWLTTVGPNITALEEEFESLIGKPAVAVSSGTAAIHLGLRVLGVGQGDEVFCSDLTFVAMCNPVRYLGAEPVLLDSDLATWHLDPNVLEDALRARAEKNKLPRAVVVAHLYGGCADLNAIVRLCQHYGVPSSKTLQKPWASGTVKSPPGLLAILESSRSMGTRSSLQPAEAFLSLQMLHGLRRHASGRNKRAIQPRGTCTPNWAITMDSAMFWRALRGVS